MDLADQLTRLNIWTRGEQRAAHNPLLLLYAISRYLRGAGRLSDAKPSGKSVCSRKLLDADAAGGLTPDLFEALQDRGEAARAIAAILEKEFPETYHEDILSALGIDLGELTLRRRRDPQFRRSGLRAPSQALRPRHDHLLRGPPRPGPGERHLCDVACPGGLSRAGASARVGVSAGERQEDRNR